MKRIWLIALVILIVIAAGLAYWFLFREKAVPYSTSPSSLSDYTSLKGEVVKASVSQNQKITTPITITGEIKGTWSFEGSFPIIIQDGSGNTLAQAPGTLSGDWMTTEYVPFSSTLTFENPSTPTGYIILKKDNPSDQRELDDSVQIPIRF